MTLSAAEKQEVNSYELFIGALSVLSIFNILLSLLLPDAAVKNVILIVDTGLCAYSLPIFWGAFGARRAKAATSSTNSAGSISWAACPSLGCASPVSSVSPVLSGSCAKWE